MNFRDVLALGLTVLLIGGCLAQPTRGVADQDDYQGPLLAGLAPGEASPLMAPLRERLRAALDATGIFAAVTPLDDPRLPNEAEVILTPVLLASTDPLRLRLRAHYKTRAEVVLDKEYRARCPTCAAGQLDETTVANLARDMARDLSKNFGRAPVE